MENVILTSITTPELKQLIRQELESFFETNKEATHPNAKAEQPINGKELCSFLDITEPTLIRWRKKGLIPFLKIGSRMLYQKSAVVAAIAGKKKGAGHGK